MKNIFPQVARERNPAHERSAKRSWANTGSGARRRCYSHRRKRRCRRGEAKRCWCIRTRGRAGECTARRKRDEHAEGHDAFVAHHVCRPETGKWPDPIVYVSWPRRRRRWPPSRPVAVIAPDANEQKRGAYRASWATQDRLEGQEQFLGISPFLAKYTDRRRPPGTPDYPQDHWGENALSR
jgi:hypothetical protein